MKNKTKTILSTLAVLAAASVPAPAAQAVPAELLRTAARTAAQICPCSATAGDLVGDVALRLWARHKELLRRENPRAYVEASVRNAWRDHLRKRRPKTFSELGNDDDGWAREPIATASTDPASDSAAMEFRAGLEQSDHAVLEQLEAGRSDREIAQRLERSRHSVRGAIQRIRRQAIRYFGDRVGS